MAEQLPVEIWVLILRHVPQADRLGRCALVSQKLRQAAAAATDALELAFAQSEEQQQQRAEAFDGYLLQHGSHLTSLKLRRGLYARWTQLPCSRLLCLEWSHSTVQLGPHNGLPGVLASCTGLTHLCLSRCQVSTGLSGLSVLVNLRDLQLVSIWTVGWWVPPATLPGSVLSCMQHLTRLQLYSVDVQHVHHISCLSSLAVLSIDCEGSVRLAPDIAPGFALPASLRDLSLTGVSMELGPSVLSAAVQLTRLELRAVVVMGQGDVSSGAALLAAVSGLHRLVTLELIRLQSAWPQPCAAYQALTASSALRILNVFDCELPAGALPHAFPRARVCGELQRLTLSDVVDGTAVPALAQRCPQLQHLQLVVRSRPVVAALKQLTGLTSLSLRAVGYGVADVAECAQGVAAIKSLRELRLYESALGPGRAALLPLTALTQLTCCVLPNCSLTNKAGPGQPPDVWQQLRRLCLESGAHNDG